MGGSRTVFFGFLTKMSSLKDDLPKWKDTDPSKREISLEISITLDKARDIGFYQFVVQQISIEKPLDAIPLTISASYRAERTDPTVLVAIGGKTYSDFNAQEILKKLQSSRSILFHNSAESETMYPGAKVAGQIREITGQHEALVASMKKTVSRGLAKISK